MIQRAIAVVACALALSACALVQQRPNLAPGEKAVLTVGPGKQYENPSDASMQALAGDTVQIFPGTYTDCAVWSQSNLTIEGMGDGVVIGNRSCAHKGVFITVGNNITVRNLTLTGARAYTHNGAGIRSEGAGLTIEAVRFIDNEDGILATPRHGGIVTIRDSYFQGNGSCIGQCAHGIYINQVDLLRVEHSEFLGQHSGHHIKSRAAVTEVVDNLIHDGPDGTASYLVDIPNGGTITITGNRFEKGPHAENPTTAIAIGAEQNKPQHQTPRIVIAGNDFVNDMSQPTVFVRNYTQTPAVLESNRIRGAVTPLEGPGTVDRPAS